MRVNSDIALHIANFRKEFRQARKHVIAAHDISFDVPAGQSVGFVGPNGAGKSTTIKALLGFIRPTLGQLSVFGHAAGTDAARSHIGFMPEHPAFPDTLTGSEWVRYAHKLHTGKRVQQTKVDTLMEEVGLGHALHRLIRGYSKGMLQRLGLAQALITDPDILVLDEPLSGLDPMGRASFKSILQRHADAGRTLFFTSHILEDVENICSRIVLIDQGKVAVDANTRELLNQATDSVQIHAQFHAEIVNSMPRDQMSFDEVAGTMRLTVTATEQAEVVRRLLDHNIDIHSIASDNVKLEELFVRVVANQDPKLVS